MCKFVAELSLKQAQIMRINSTSADQKQKMRSLIPWKVKNVAYAQTPVEYDY